MPTLEVTLSLKMNGTELTSLGFPIIRRVEVDEAQPFDVTRATGGGYVALPTGELDEIQVLVVKSDQSVTLRLDGQSDAGIVVNAGGIVVLFDTDLDDGASTNATLDNSSGSDAQIKGIAGGT